MKIKRLAYSLTMSWSLFYIVRRKSVGVAEELARQAAIRNRVVVRAAAGLGLFLFANLSRLIKKLAKRASAPLLYKANSSVEIRSYDLRTFACPYTYID